MTRRKTKGSKATTDKKSRKKLRPDRGFELRIDMRVMGVSDIEFNQALVQAVVTGCGYGFRKVDGLDGYVPCITLIGSNPAGFITAYRCFSRWGCEEDGDVVTIDFLLRTDGTYDLWVGPE